MNILHPGHARIEAFVDERPDWGGVVDIADVPIAYGPGHLNIWSGSRRNANAPQLGRRWFLMVDVPEDDDERLEQFLVELAALQKEFYG